MAPRSQSSREEAQAARSTYDVAEIGPQNERLKFWISESTRIEAQYVKHIDVGEPQAVLVRFKSSWLSRWCGASSCVLPGTRSLALTLLPRILQLTRRSFPALAHYEPARSQLLRVPPRLDQNHWLRCPCRDPVTAPSTPPAS